MYYYRLTKYDPRLRDENGRYVRDGWTFYDDVGLSFKGKVLSLEEYESVEKKYIESIKFLLECIGSFKLECEQVQKHNSISDIPENFRGLYNQVKNGFVVDEETLPDMLKLLMRNDLWCSLSSKGIVVLYDYDSYFLIRLEKPCLEVLRKINDLGLFMEEYKSPWIDY